MASQSATGRRLVLGVIVVTIGLSALVIVATNLALGPARLPVQIVRFLLTVALSIFLYRGANWARWVGVVLFAIGGLSSLLLSLGGLPGTGAWLLLALGVTYLVCAGILLFVPSVRTHFGVLAADAG
jgi:hypothetical protein